MSTRFTEHYYNRNGKQDKTQEILLNGGCFVCLKSFSKDTNEQTIRKCESDYIEKYKNTEKTLLNEKDIKKVNSDIPAWINTDNLIVGEIYTYKQICDLTGAEYKAGKYRNIQMYSFMEKSLARFMKLEKVNWGKYKVLEIYETPLDIIDKRSFGNARGYHKINITQDCFDINDEEIAHSPGVYKIENDEYVYIGSTITWLTKRFSQHYNNYDGKHNKTQEVLQNGGTFTCLQSFENGTEEPIIRECEAKYIREYRNIGKILLNERIPEVFSKEEQIEYDVIKIPKEHFGDVSDVLMDAGYLIMGNMVYNKKFIDD